MSGGHLQMSANQNLIATAGGNADIGVLKRFTVAAGEAVSLLAQKLGMKLFAARGKVEIQAQGDEMALAALKDITITSTEGKLVLSAAKEVWIGAGGSYIRINAERIENGTPGDILEKCAYWEKPRAASMRVPLPSLPLSNLTQRFAHEYTQIFNVSPLLDYGQCDSVLNGKPYRIYLPGGTIQQQGMLTNGTTAVVRTLSSTLVKCEIGAGDWAIHEDAYDKHEIETDSQIDTETVKP
jgi:type VI secretion system secreted protein VgrG